MLVLFGGTELSYVFTGTDQWVSLTQQGTVAPAPTGVGASIAYAGADFSYVFRGGDTTDFWRYNIRTHVFDSRTAAPATVGVGGSLVYARSPADFRDYIYAFRGDGTTDFWRHDIIDNTWIAMAVAPAAVGAGGSLVWSGGDSIYAFRGGGTNAFWRYQISTNTWNPSPGISPAITGGVPAPAPAAIGAGGSLVCITGDFIYAFRGGGTTDFWRYQISANVWNPAPGASPAIVGGLPARPGAAVGEGGSLANVGGSFIYALLGGGSTDFWFYDVARNTWTRSTAAPSAIGAGAAMGSTSYAYMHPVDSIPPSRVNQPGWAAQTLLGTGVMLCSDCHDVHASVLSSSFPVTTRARGSLRGTRGVEPAPGSFPGSQPRSIPTAVPGAGVTMTGTALPARLFAVAGGNSNRFFGYDLRDGTRRELLPAPVNVPDGSPLVWNGSGDRLYLLVGGTPGTFLSYSVNSAAWTTETSPGNTAAGMSLVWGGGDLLYASLGGSTAFRRFNMSTGAWADLAAAPAALGSGASLVHPGGDFIYAFRGDGSTAFWRYQISTNTWNPNPGTSPGISGGVSGAALAAVTGGASLVHGGGDFLYAFSGGTAFWRYSISANAWSAMAAAPVAMAPGSSLTYPRGGFHLYASQGGGGALWQYNIVSNTWTALASAPTAFGAGAGIIWTGADYLWVTGGGSAGFNRYSQARNVWESVAAVPAPGITTGGALVYAGANFIYAFRGGGSLTFGRYAQGTADGGTFNTWIDVAAPPAAPGAGAALVWTENDFIYAFQGGTTAFWRYQVSFNAWIAMAPAPAVVGAGASLVYPGSGDFIYAFRGGDTTDFWRYQLSTNAWATMPSAPAVIVPAPACSTRAGEISSTPPAAASPTPFGATSLVPILGPS